MHFGRPILAFDVVYNRETTKGKAAYYTNANDLLQLISKNVDNGKVLKEIACKEYTWAKIAKEYEALY
jgi:glycosyltransferase involved in cell wall biosynthesis